MWKSKVILLVIFLMLASLIIPHNINADIIYTEKLDTNQDYKHKEFIDNDSIDLKDRSQDPYGPLQIQKCNNSWLDSFHDPVGIDWGKSDNLNITDGHARIHIPYFPDGQTVALWHFDEGSGANVYDETINYNDGTITGASWTTGKVNNGLSFDGNNDRVYISDSASLSIKGAITISCWVKFSQLPTSGRFHPLVSKIEAGSDTYRFIIRDTGKPAFIIRSTSGGASVTADTALNDNQWHLITGTWDKSLIKIYVDGVPDATPVSHTGNMVDTPDEVRLGYTRVWQGGNPYWWYYTGIMDEVRISKIGRSALEIKDLYENGTPSKNATANLTSKVITVPNNMNWDSLIIDKSEPKDTYLNITILDASNDLQIPGSPKYLTSGEFDISNIDANQYPSIKLNATFKGNNYFTPVLYYWGVSWNASNSWQDSFFTNYKVETIDTQKVDVVDGEAKFLQQSSLISKSINLPNYYHYDELRINKTEPIGSFINVTVLDAQTNNGIPGFENLSETTIDITPINPKKYPAIKLKAFYESYTIDPAFLFDWSVNWTPNTTPKFLNISSSDLLNRTSSIEIEIDVIDHEEAINYLTLIVEYKSPIDLDWKADYIVIEYKNSRWVCTFNPTVDAVLGYYSFKFYCNDTYEYSDTQIKNNFIRVINNKPIIWEIQTVPWSAKINRLDMLKIKINVSDIELNPSELIINTRYKSSLGSIWETKYISEKKYSNDSWEVTFSPGISAHLGNYLFNISCNDSDSEVFALIDIIVTNNKPGPPEVTILPMEPTTKDDLEIQILKSSDLETPINNLKYWYHWYKDDFYMPEFDNLTIIPNSATVKGQTWRCDVFAFDGDDIGQAGLAEAIIINSPPELIEPFVDYLMYEDEPVILQKKLINIFDDPDYDKLTFIATDQKHIDIEIIQELGTIKFTPIKNWFGTEYITFHANDSMSIGANTTVGVRVIPTNDLPAISFIENQATQEGYPELEFIVKQNDWLNLTIQAYDIDGDVASSLIKYSTNLTKRDNFYFLDRDKKIVFQPNNNDVGWHHINIKISDNNETPLVYISQDIRIQVVNVNDPPTVQIIGLDNGMEFSEKEKISFSCFAIDLDLLLSNSDEKLEYTWYLDKNEVGVIGTGSELTERTLPPGEHNITIKVEDNSGEVAFDSVYIKVREIPQEKVTSSELKEESLATDYLWLALILLIITIIIICLLIYNTNQRKKRERKEEMLLRERVLQPAEAYQPLPGTHPGMQGTLQPSLISQGAPLPATTQEPQAQLPQGRSIKARLNYQQKLSLLEERLLKGEISQDTYATLKEKYELEIKKYEPLPQLPPAPANISTTSTTSDLPSVQKQPSQLSQTQPTVIQTPLEQDAQTTVQQPSQVKEDNNIDTSDTHDEEVSN